MAGVGEFGHLVRHGGHDLGVAMPGVHHRDPGGKVDISVALDIPDFTVQRPIRVDLGHHSHPARDGVVTAFGYFGVQHGVSPDILLPRGLGALLDVYLIK